MGCRHYNGPLDMRRNRCASCGLYWDCHLCHAAATDHVFAPMLIDAPLSTQCASCRGVMPYGHAQCPHCGQGFNPGCSLHDHIYYEF